MQLIVILAVLGLVNIVGLGAATDADKARRGMDKTEYRATVEVEDVAGKQSGSLIEAIRN